MGQRLVVTIERKEESLAKLYFHWSAYTGDALYVTRDIIHCIYNHKDETDREMLLRLIRFCEERGGGIDGGEGSEAWKYITTTYPDEKFKSEGISRSEGLIAINEEDMEEMQRMSEGDVYINLDEDRVDFCVYAGYESLDEYLEEMGEDEDLEGLTVNDIPYIDHDLGYFDVDEIDAIIDAFEKTDDVQNLIRFRDEIVELC
jgi:hypothetical protein